MSRMRITLAAVTILLASAGIQADDAVPQVQQQQIEALIKQIESLDDAKFIRNGSEYDAKAAARFLKAKWDANPAGVNTADDFIEKIASISSTSGKPYLIRLKDGQEIKAGDYLRSRIKQVAQIKAPDAADKHNRVFEIRTYTAEEGKLDALLARFRDHTCKLFEKHGMTNIGYWVPQDEPRSKNTLIYIIAHGSREAAKKNWDAFRNDPEWKRVQTESEAGGKLVTKVESVYVDPTDFSPLK